MSTYDPIAITWRAPLVEHAPDQSRITVDVLRQMHAVHIAGSDRIYVGDLRDGTPVLYRITGWDADEKALIVERCR